MDIEQVGVLIIRKEGNVVGLVYNDIAKRSQIFFSVSEMGMEEIKELLECQNIKN